MVLTIPKKGKEKKKGNFWGISKQKGEGEEIKKLLPMFSEGAKKEKEKWSLQIDAGEYWGERPK